MIVVNKVGTLNTDCNPSWPSLHHLNSKAWKTAQNNTEWSQKLEYSFVSACRQKCPRFPTILEYPSLSLNWISRIVWKQKELRELQTEIPSHRKEVTWGTEKEIQSKGWDELTPLNIRNSYLSTFSNNPILANASTTDWTERAKPASVRLIRSKSSA